MPLEGTGVYATPEELKELTDLAAQGWQPREMMIVTSVMKGIIKDQKTTEGKVICHKLALSHDLPEFSGYYGIQNDGEFVKLT